MKKYNIRIAVVEGGARRVGLWNCRNTTIIMRLGKSNSSWGQRGEIPVHLAILSFHASIKESFGDCLNDYDYFDC